MKLKLLDAMERAALRTLLPAWSVQDEALVKHLRFEKFRTAIEFVQRVADLAEAADHHPDIDIRYTTVRLLLTTHDAGGLTALDVDLARKIDALGQ
jgi:4a-hydroxytetrahydrobiopterin dehydratase